MNISWNREIDLKQAVYPRFSIELFLEDISNAPNAPSKAEIIQQLKEHLEANIDPWLVCNGHDLIRLLAVVLPICLRKYTQNPESFPHQRLTELLRASYEFAFFQQTNLYNEIRQWEEANTPYRIFQLIGDTKADNS